MELRNSFTEESPDEFGNIQDSTAIALLRTGDEWKKQQHNITSWPNLRAWFASPTGNVSAEVRAEGTEWLRYVASTQEKPLDNEDMGSVASGGEDEGSPRVQETICTLFSTPKRNVRGPLDMSWAGDDNSSKVMTSVMGAKTVSAMGSDIVKPLQLVTSSTLDLFPSSRGSTEQFPFMSVARPQAKTSSTKLTWETVSASGLVNVPNSSVQMHKTLYETVMNGTVSQQQAFFAKYAECMQNYVHTENSHAMIDTHLQKSCVTSITVATFAIPSLCYQSKKATDHPLLPRVEILYQRIERLLPRVGAMATRLEQAERVAYEAVTAVDILTSQVEAQIQLPPME